MAQARPEAVTRVDVVWGSNRITSKHIQKRSVIEGEEFPIKQIPMTAAHGLHWAEPRVTLAYSIAGYAASRRKKLGFKIEYAK